MVIEGYAMGFRNFMADMFRRSSWFIGGAALILIGIALVPVLWKLVGMIGVIVAAAVAFVGVGMITYASP